DSGTEAAAPTVARAATPPGPLARGCALGAALAPAPARRPGAAAACATPARAGRGRRARSPQGDRRRDAAPAATGASREPLARRLDMGDYANLSLTVDIDLLQTGGGPPTLPTNLPTVLDPTAVVGGVLACLTSGDLGGAECRAVLRNVEQLLKLREECTKP